MKIELTDVATIGIRIIDEVEKAIIGKRSVIENIMAAVLADGHVLLEDYPGLGKTLLASSLAHTLGLTFKRIQFTPDLLPGDITGGYIYNRAADQFQLRSGPIFANIVLADEINRASPKTQSALLEAMQEQQVTLEGETRMLPRPFIVLATQNPIEYEGTFPLPEAQLDRFMIRLAVGYPSENEEQEILRRRRERQQEMVELDQITDEETLLAMREMVETVHVEPDLEQYMVRLVAATRNNNRVAVGASPRGSLALLKLSRARAALQGRAYILPDDIKHFAEPALAHRLILIPELWMRRGADRQIVQNVMDSVNVPVFEGQST